MNSFLEEEVRCGFKVDKKRKKIWEIELDMMEKFTEICEKYNLQYFLLGGSALGAVRHQGFIPWDDDIDLGMKREDFKVFMEKAQKELRSPYFLQYLEGNQHFDGILRIRNSETTGILFQDFDSGKECNSGIFIEIYPLDNVPNNKILRFIQNTRIRFYYAQIIRKIYHIQDSFIKRIFCVIHKKTSLTVLFHKYEKICQKYNKKANCRYCNTLTTPEAARKEYNLIAKEDIERAIKVPFEYMQLCVPNGNDRILHQHYGDYMQLPPLEERGNYHNDTVYYDPFTSYRDVMESDIVKVFFYTDN